MKRISVVLFLGLLLASAFFGVSDELVSASLVEDTWTHMAPMSQARAGLGVVAVNGKIYAIGGTTASGQWKPDMFSGGFVATNEEYDPSTNTWATKASMPTARDYFAIAAVGDKIYCIGGAKGHYRDVKLNQGSYIETNVTEVYDTKTNSWATKASIPSTVINMLANVVDGKIYVMHGYYTYVYDPVDDSWANKTKIPASLDSWYSNPPVSFVVDKKIYVTGVFQTKPLYEEKQRVFIYDTESDSWSETGSWSTRIGAAGCGLTTGVKAPPKAYIFGRTGPFPSVPITQVYDFGAESWSTANTMYSVRRDFGVAVVDDVIYVIGGYKVTSRIYGMVAPVGWNERYVPLGYGVAPKINVSSPISQIYNESSVPLVFYVDKPFDYLVYSLDGAENVTILSNVTLTDLSNGYHNVTVYACDLYGNVGASETVMFCVDKPEVLPVGLFVVAVVVVIVCAGIVVYLKKHKRNT